MYRRARETVIARDAAIQAEEELLKKKEEELEMRKKESRDLVGETIRREMAERESFFDEVFELDTWKIHPVKVLDTPNLSVIRFQITFRRSNGTHSRRRRYR